MAPAVALGGAIELAAVLRRQFLRGGADPAALRLGEPQGAAVYIHLLAGEAGEEDERVLRDAKRAGVPAVAVATGTASVPYVFATAVVRVEEGHAFPLATIAHAVAGQVGEDGAPLAARVPILRDAVCRRLTSISARRAALAPDDDARLLVLFRLVLGIAEAYDEEPGVARLPELLATLGAGLGLRAVARQAVDAVPVPGRVVKGAVAYAGTRAVGEAARKRFALSARPALPAALTRRLAAAVPVAP